VKTKHTILVSKLTGLTAGDLPPGTEIIPASESVTIKTV